jgi:hypothetical protein
MLVMLPASQGTSFGVSIGVPLLPCPMLLQGYPCCMKTPPAFTLSCCSMSGSHAAPKLLLPPGGGTIGKPL